MSTLIVVQRRAKWPALPPSDMYDKSMLAERTQTMSLGDSWRMEDAPGLRRLRSVAPVKDGRTMRCKPSLCLSPEIQHHCNVLCCCDKMLRLSRFGNAKSNVCLSQRSLPTYNTAEASYLIPRTALPANQRQPMRPSLIPPHSLMVPLPPISSGLPFHSQDGASPAENFHRLTKHVQLRH